MELKERVYSVLVLSSSESFDSSVRNMLPEFKFSPVDFCGDISSAKRTLLERSFDFLFINSPLVDGTGIRFAIDTCKTRNTVVLVFVKSELYSETHDRLSEHGVYVISKPTAKNLFLQAVDWLITTRELLDGVSRKSVSLEEKMGEIRTINRAKWLLIDRLKMTEEEAHQYIVRQAMDSCVSKTEIAESIIRTYA